MEEQESKKNFVDFIVDAQKDTKLAKDFLNLKSPKDLKAFFIEKGYDGIRDTDFDKLAKVTEGMQPDILDKVGPRAY